MVMERFPIPLDTGAGMEHFMQTWPDMLAWPMFGWGAASRGVLRVDEYREDGSLVVRTELPDIDPDTDLQVTASEGVLHIAVERHAEDAHHERSYLRHELVHRRRLERDLTLPEGAKGSELTATYQNGVLEIRMPLPPGRTEPPVTRIPVAKA